MRHDTLGKIDSCFYHSDGDHKTEDYLSVMCSLKMREQLSLVLYEDLSDALSFFVILAQV